MVVHGRFRRVVNALVAAVLRTYDPEITAASIECCAAFVQSQHDRMPDYLRLGISGFTCLFDFSAILWHGRSFVHLSDPDQARHIDRWKHSRLSAMRDLVKFYESLATFSWISQRYDTQP